VSPDPLLAARADVLHDLAVCGATTPDVVSLVEDIVVQRRWWVEQWPAGGEYVGGQVAQDVQEALLDLVGRWPACPHHADEPHELRISPDLGPDPHWVCETDGTQVARLGAL